MQVDVSGCRCDCTVGYMGTQQARRITRERTTLGTSAGIGPNRGELTGLSFSTVSVTHHSFVPGMLATPHGSATTVTANPKSTPAPMWLRMPIHALDMGR